ncbi:hypothetical protein Dimus_022607 [Dionaea muscipula]
MKRFTDPEMLYEDMTKGRRLQLPSGVIARGGRGRRGVAGRGRPDSPDRVRASARDPEDRDRRSFRDAEDRPPKPPSAELTRGKGVASDYPRESQKRRLPTGLIDFQDPVGGRESAVPLGGSTCGFSSSMTSTSYAKERFKYEMIDGHRVELDSNGNILPRDLRFAGPQPKICGLPLPDDGFICYEYNALALAQAMANSLTNIGKLISVSQETIADQDAARKKVKTMEEEIVGLRSLHTELTSKYNELQDSVQRLEGSLKTKRNQSTSHLKELESARSKCEELEGKIESEEGMAAISELTRPATKVGYSMAFQHFGSYLSEVPIDKKWDGLPWPHDDIGVMDQNVPYYIVDGPPPPVIIDAEEEGELGEVIIAELEGSLKKERNQSTSRLTELESARSKCEELEGKIERLERRIAQLEQQHPSSMDEVIDRWQTSEEGMAAISELARPATKAGYSMAFQHFGSYLSEVPADKKWDGLPWPHDDIGVMDQNVPYYIVDGPPPPVIVDAEEEGELGEVIIADS